MLFRSEGRSWGCGQRRGHHLHLVHISLAHTIPEIRPRDYQQQKGRLWEQCDHCNAFSALLDSDHLQRALKVCTSSLSQSFPLPAISPSVRQVQAASTFRDKTIWLSPRTSPLHPHLHLTFLVLTPHTRQDEAESEPEEHSSPFPNKYHIFGHFKLQDRFLSSP